MSGHYRPPGSKPVPERPTGRGSEVAPTGAPTLAADVDDADDDELDAPGPVGMAAAPAAGNGLDRPDLAEVVQFLRWWMEITGAPHVTLVAILPDASVVYARTFARGDEEAACAWVADHQATGRGLYFQPNETRADCIKKPGKADMVAVLCRHADVDPDDRNFPWAEERERLTRLAETLAASEYPPTGIIDSGNGMQPIWAVAREPLTPEVIARVEAETAAIERSLGASGTHNVDRLLRLPGSLNRPNKVKRDKGRGVTRARLLYPTGNLYRPDQVGNLVNGGLVEAGLVRPRRGGGSSPGATADPIDVKALIAELEQAGGNNIQTETDLPEVLQQRLAAALALDPETMTDRDYARRKRLADRWAGLVDDLTEAGRDDSRSGADMSLAAMLKAAGFDHVEAGLILLAFRHGKANNEEWDAEALRLRHVARSVLRSHEQPPPDPVTASFFDPWADPPPPEFPGGILTREVEDVVFALALRDGICPGALAMGYLTAVSGAAMKASRFLPYQNSAWWVPPIVWMLLIADSGQRKTAVEALAFAALRQLDADLWGPFAAALRLWKALPAKERAGTPKPPEPHTFLAEDTTPEQLQIILSNTTRGTFLRKDEMAGFFDFARYQGPSKNAGAASRAFYLQAYEAGPYTVSRVTRDSLHIANNALTIFGSIQPDRLIDFPDLAKDGLLQRINTVRASPAAGSRDNITVKRHDLVDARITGLAQDDIAQVYRTTQDGSALIRQTEADGQAMAAIADYGQGFQGTCSKLHGTHARYALILHLLNSTGATLIPTDTVERARRLVREFLLPQAGSFFANLAGSPYQRMREAAGWILTKATTRFVASDLTAGVRGCRGMRTKDIGEMLDPLVSGGWLEPESPFPSNRAWEVHPLLRTALADRVKAEAERRARVRELWRMVGTEGFGVLRDLPKAQP